MADSPLGLRRRLASVLRPGRPAPAPPRPPGFELDETFASLADWTGWAGRHPEAFNPQYVDAVAGRILAFGFVEPLSGRTVTPAEIGGERGNWREGLFAHGINSRQRAVLHLIEQLLQDCPREQATVFATEAVTGLAALLRAHYPRFLGSEFAEDEATRRMILPALHQDLMRLDLPSDAFDLVATNDVLEHVPDIDTALGEIARVLKPGGWQVSTFPFRIKDEDGDLRSVLRDGKVVHLKPPELHGNPVAPERGSLVFETPGWNILERCRKAGFAQADIRFVASERHGYLTEHLGVSVLCARK